MRARTLVVLVLMIGMLTPTDVVAVTNPIEAVQISLSDGILLNRPSIDLIAYRNRTLGMKLVLPFEYVGPNPMISLKIQHGQQTTPTVIPKAGVVVNVIYYPKGIGRLYMWGRYTDSFIVEPEDGASSFNYPINLTNQQDKVFTFLSPEVENLTINDVGYQGIVFFYHRFEDAVVQTLHEYYVRIPFTLAGNMLGFKLALRIPETATWIDKIWQDEPIMHKEDPKEVYEEMSIDVNESITSELYAEWRILEEPTLTFWETPQGQYWTGFLASSTVWGLTTVGALALKNRSRIGSAFRRLAAWLSKRWRQIHSWAQARTKTESN